MKLSSAISTRVFAVSLTHVERGQGAGRDDRGVNLHKIANLPQHGSKYVQIRYGPAPGGNKQYYITFAKFTLRLTE
jgi:hypothetical protein